jgi:archaetidylinositol phosphate synthase
MTKAKETTSTAKSTILTPSKVIPLPKRKAKKIKPHTRVQGSMLHPLERPLLLWLAARLPKWISPDILTGIGVLGGLVIFAGYALTNLNKYYMILASFGFFLNWFGDSLDGTVARYRKIERPKYGFFIDHSVDGFIVACIFIGAGLSPFISYHIATFAMTGYLLLSIHVYITTYVTGVFKMSYAKLGPTEARLLAIIGNMVIMAMAKPHMHLFDFTFTFYDFIGIFIGSVTWISFFVHTIRKGRMLSQADRANMQ